MIFAFNEGGAVRRCLLALIVTPPVVMLAGCSFLQNPHGPPPSVQSLSEPTDPYVKPEEKFIAPPVATAPLVLSRGQTVVSITFDDGRASQATAAEMMHAHSLPGTFYVNSGTVGMPGHLSLSDLHSMAMSGHEIGGHSLTHPQLPNLPADEITRQVCDDRKTLLGWGFAVRSFAYPFDQVSEDTEHIVRSCGYESARALGDVDSPNSCAWCVPAEAVPPANPMRTRAPNQVEKTWTTADLERLVHNAEQSGGWLQLVFHDVCTTECSKEAIHQAQFEEFLAWLANQRDQGYVLVRAVGDVVGGPVQPAVPGPVTPPAPPGVNGVKNPGLEDQADGAPVCWMQGGFGNNTSEFSRVPTGHSGTTADRLVMRNYVDGDAKLLQTTDLGACAPAVSPERRYTIQAWYTSTVPTSFSVQYRLARGVWVYGLSSPKFPRSDEFSLARWTLPPIPEGVTAVSFGLTLAQNGELVTDDYSLTDDTESPHQ